MWTNPPSGQALDRLLAEAKAARRHDIGYPGATDLTFPELSEWLTGQLLNNVGDPYHDGHGRNHTKQHEREVVDLIGDWLHAPPSRWGHVTSGATEGNLHALHTARQTHPDLIVYASATAHYSIEKSARLLRLPLITIRAHPDGRMNIDDLAGELRLRRDRPAAIVATVGTTMTEAIDDIPAIINACDHLAITRRHLHVDAALSGIPLALLPETQRPAFDLATGADSIVISGHKFLSTLMPCGVLIYRQAPHSRADRSVPYIGTLDTTVLGSRNGHTPLLLWSALTRLDAEGHRARAAARDLATYALDRLTGIGWNATRPNPLGFTIILDPPPAAVRAKWILADDGQHAHLITMPGITHDQIDEFVSDLETAAPRRAMPKQRRRVLRKATS